MTRTLITLSIALAATLLHATHPKEKTNFVETNINARNFTIEVRQALPRKGPSIPLTSDYSLHISGDTIISYLPYYGQAYSIPYGGGQGLNFQGTATQYSVKKNKKGEFTVEFKVRSNDDQMKYILSIFPGGNTSIIVVPTNRETISYQGEMIDNK